MEKPDNGECPPGPLDSPVVLGAALFIAFVCVEPLFFRAAHRAPATYSGYCILWNSLSSQTMAILFAAGALLATQVRRLSWNRSQPGMPQARAVVTVLIFIFAWTCSTYSYNFWYGQWHLADRVLLLLFAGLAVWNPAFLLLFAVHTTLMTGQFMQPLGFSWTDKVPLFETLYLASLWQVLRLFLRARHENVSHAPFLFAMLILWGAFYFVTGCAKLRIGWFAHNTSENILFGAWLQNGWPASFSEPSIRSMADVVRFLGPLFKVVVLCVELGAGFLLLRPRFAVAVLIGAAAMHVGIFALTGICFWKWAVMDLVLVGSILTLPSDLAGKIFSPRRCFVGCLLGALFFGVSSRPVWLGWLDSELVYRFEIRATDSRGNTHQVPAGLFAPYDLTFAQGRFYFLTETPRVVDCLGSASSVAGSDAIHELMLDNKALDLVRQENGRSAYDARKREDFVELLKRFFASKEHSANRRLAWIQPPHHIWSGAQPFDEADVLPEGAQVRRVEVRLTEWIVRPKSIDKIHDERVVAFEVDRVER